jgi:8-oxo-dGTP diphosphatase
MPEEKNTFVYEHPRPMVTVDIFLLRYAKIELEILLIQRNHPPYEGNWALPGGFIEMDEPLVKAAQRELQEETGLKHIQLSPLIFVGDPGRDPRGRTITAVYCGILRQPFQKLRAGDDAGVARWFSLKRLPDMAFDHLKIIGESLNEFKFAALWKLWILNFLPDRFSYSEFEELTENILENKNISGDILYAALHLSLIQKRNEDSYQMRTNMEKLYALDFSLLFKTWVSFIEE